MLISKSREAGECRTHPEFKVNFITDLVNSGCEILIELHNYCQIKKRYKKFSE
jgi:hypothetical protein